MLACSSQLHLTGPLVDRRHLLSTLLTENIFDMLRLRALTACRLPAVIFEKKIGGLGLARLGLIDIRFKSQYHPIINMFFFKVRNV